MVTFGEPNVTLLVVCSCYDARGYIVSSEQDIVTKLHYIVSSHQYIVTSQYQHNWTCLKW